MAPQKRRRYQHLPAFILLVLADGPLHGGAIRTSITERITGTPVDSAATYRTLQGLEEEGAVSSTWDTDAPGPALRVYRLTELGLERLAGWKADIEYRITILNRFVAAYDRLPLAGR